MEQMGPGQSVAAGACVCERELRGELAAGAQGVPGMSYVRNTQCSQNDPRNTGSCVSFDYSKKKKAILLQCKAG